KSGAEAPLFQLLSARGPAGNLQGNDVRSLRAFLALGNGELDLLAFSQGLEAVAADCAEVCKHVRAILLLSGADAFDFVQPLYCGGNCIHMVSLNVGKSCCVARRQRLSREVMTLLMRYRSNALRTFAVT